MTPTILHLIFLFCHGHDRCQQELQNCIHAKLINSIEFGGPREQDVFLDECIEWRQQQQGEKNGY